MSHPPALQRFIDDEIARAPLLLDQVLLAVERPRDGEDTRGSDPRLTQDLKLAVQAQRADMIARFCASLREQVNDQPAAGLARAARGLSLVDEEEVSADVELSRTVESIASVAEYELRELRAFTSALVGDLEVARETNPFRPEVYARALWAAAGALPLSRGFQVAFMRRAAMPLASALRLAYAAACTRLEDTGVEPGAYRTIILPAGSRTRRREQVEAPPPELPLLRDSMPVPLDEPPAQAPPLDEALSKVDRMLRLLPDDAGMTTRAQTLDSHRMRLLESASTRVDQQLIELLSRLFDAMLSDRRLAPQVQVLISRLHASALRVALRDPITLDSYQHPVWLFVDRIAFGAELHPRDGDPLRSKLFNYVQGLIDNMSRESVQDAALYHWGLERLNALERHLFEQRVADATQQIEALRTLSGSTEAAPAPHTAGGEPLDVATLDTVPAELMGNAGDDAPQRAEDAAAWLQGNQDGTWVRMFVQGQWRTAQLLWHDTQLWLYAEAGDTSTWALRRAALERLHAEGLLDPLAPRSLVQRAAEVVLRQVVTPAAKP